MKRLWAFLLIVIAACGCGQSDPGAGEQITGDTLTVVTSFDATDGNRDAFWASVKRFEEKTGVTVSEDSSKSDELWKKQVVADFESGNTPDVLFFFKGVPQVVDQCVSLDEIQAVYPEYASDLSATVLNDMKEPDGSVYAVPVTGFWEGMFINKSLFAQNSIRIPTTYDELLSAVEQFRALNITPIAASLTYEPHYLFEFLLYNKNGPAGHMRVPPSADDVAFPRWEAALTDFHTLYELGAFPDDINISHLDALEMFQQKQAAMFVDGSWRVGSIADTDDVLVVPFPGSSERKATDLLGGFSMGFYITRSGWENNREAAVAFVKTMCEKESIAQFNVNGAAAPIASDTETFDNGLLSSISEMNQAATAFVPAIQDSFDSGARDHLFKDISAVATGQLSAKDALTAFIELNSGGL